MLVTLGWTRLLKSGRKTLTGKPWNKIMRRASADVRVRLFATGCPFPLKDAITCTVVLTKIRNIMNLLDVLRRAQEKHINSFPHWKVPVESLDIHFVGLFSTKPDAIPLLLLHGWPGQFFSSHDFSSNEPRDSGSEMCAHTDMDHLGCQKVHSLSSCLSLPISESSTRTLQRSRTTSSCHLCLVMLFHRHLLSMSNGTRKTSPGSSTSS